MSTEGVISFNASWMVHVSGWLWAISCFHGSFSQRANGVRVCQTIWAIGTNGYGGGVTGLY